MSAPDFDFGLPFLNEEIGTPVCAETDPDMFFPEERDDPNVRHMTSVYYNEKGAKSVCFGCEYRIKCLLFALENREIGIWGGTTERERRNMLQKAKREQVSIVEIAIGKKR